jgi:glycosyltransferase involved in cell wall biosynthesis
MASTSIVHLITELDTGGAQMALLRFLAHYDHGRYQHKVTCLFNGDQIVAQQIRALGIEVVDLGMTRPYRLDALWRLFRLLKRERPAILHCWLYHADIIGRVVGRAASVPRIITSRRDVYIGGPQREWLKRLTASLDHKTIAVCEAARQAELRQANPDPTKVVAIYNGVEIGQFQYNNQSNETIRREFSIPVDAFLIGTIARLHPQKGHKQLLEAMRLLRQNHPQIYCLIVGDGALRTELEALSEALGLSDRVIFAGNRQDTPALLHTFDLFVLPSLWEGFPNVVLEAMAAGTIVIATNVDGTPELISDGETGLLIPPADPQAIVEAVSRLFQDREQAAKMAAAAYQLVKTNFLIEHTVAQIEAIYDQLL